MYLIILFSPLRRAGCAKKLRDLAVYLCLHLLCGLFTQVAQHAVVKDHVLRFSTLDRLIRALAALDVGTEQFPANAHPTAGTLDEASQVRQFLV